jgi:pilus assembly protein Flp/PilA
MPVVLGSLTRTKEKIMKNFVSGITRFFKEEEGASAVEYGILVALIAVAIIIIVQLLGAKLENVFNQVCYRINKNIAC